MMDNSYFIGVDIGGSHISCAGIDPVEGKIIRDTVVERPVNNKGTAGEITGSWAAAIAVTLDKAGHRNLKGIGFAMPGPFDYVKGICLIKGVPKYENLYGTDIGKAVSSALSLPADMPVRFMNDASSFAVGEAWTGKAAGSSRSVAITLGTGFGSAFIADKIPVVRGGNVPELGCVYHIAYGDGIADDYFSTRWFIDRYRQISGKEAGGVKEIAGAAVYDKGVKNIFTEFGTSLALFLSPFLIKFDAEVLVLGGNISRAYDLFGKEFENELKKQGCNTTAFLSELREDAALLGSARLLDDLFWEKVKGSLQYM